MADFRAEQNLDSSRASSPAFSNFELQNLWTMDNIRALNSTAKIGFQSISQFPDFSSPIDPVGVIARGADGFTLFDNSRLLSSKDTGPDNQPVKTGAEVINIAEKLGQDPHRWAQTKESPAPKCNQYVEAVLQAALIPFPWKPGQADCHAMRMALDKESAHPSSNWQKIYAYDDMHGLQSDERFTHYQPKDGDVIIWDGVWGDHYIQHSGIAAKPYDILYAGSVSHRAPHGWAHGEITDFTLSKHSYGSPTAVYRYKGLD